MPKYSKKELPAELEQAEPLDELPQKTKKRSLLHPIIISTFILLSLATLGAYIFRHELGLPKIISQQPAPKPNLARYNILKKDLEIRRVALAKKYQTAPNNTSRQAILKDAGELLQAVLPEMMRCWLGTPWDFHGTAKGPGQGKIACGYFVSTNLKDAGFKVNRYTLAQQASQNILQTFVNKSRTQTRVGLSYNEFLTVINALPKGIYIVGLDHHVGFIVHDGTNIRFIHSSGRSPYTVVDESDIEAVVLKHSNYRVFGNLTAERETLKKWLQQTTFEVKK